jgi:hypothetical protein
MSALNLAEARKIGFNDSVAVEGAHLHVQTEVLTRGGVVIRTTVLHGGVTKLVESHPVPPHVSDVGALAMLVQTQHQRCFDQVKRGGVSK